MHIIAVIVCTCHYDGKSCFQLPRYRWSSFVFSPQGTDEIFLDNKISATHLPINRKQVISTIHLFGLLKQMPRPKGRQVSIFEWSWQQISISKTSHMITSIDQYSSTLFMTRIRTNHQRPNKATYFYTQTSS